MAGTLTSPHDLARKHLFPKDAERWTGLLKFGAHLRKAGEGDPVVGRLGGPARLPEGTEWPVWEGNGPLAFVAAIDCGALRSAAREWGWDPPLRTDGRLAFFYDAEGADMVDACDPDTWAGARVLHLPPGCGESPERAASDGPEPYDTVPLTAEFGPSAPARDSPALCRAFGFASESDLRRHPVGSGPFAEERDDRFPGGGHQMLGHPQSIQGAVEIEVARGALGGGPGPSDPRVRAEAERWVLLAQFDGDEDAGVMWGDSGVLYWLIRPEDLEANRFERAVLTWQSC